MPWNPKPHIPHGTGVPTNPPSTAQPTPPHHTRDLEGVASVHSTPQKRCSCGAEPLQTHTPTCDPQCCDPPPKTTHPAALHHTPPLFHPPVHSPPHITQSVAQPPMHCCLSQTRHPAASHDAHRPPQTTHPPSNHTPPFVSQVLRHHPKPHTCPPPDHTLCSILWCTQTPQKHTLQGAPAE